MDSCTCAHCGTTIKMTDTHDRWGQYRPKKDRLRALNTKECYECYIQRITEEQAHLDNHHWDAMQSGDVVFV